ncbi:MAG: ABC transporter substrate-binding protein [Candidatus Eremiobacteraeota bacterium]|nr:ABC transporter substrate-binding protein [Candidatus Eremiobacteraeota bacterium]
MRTQSLGARALLVAVGLLLAGCGGTAPVRPLDGSSGPVLIVARVKDAVTLDPAQASDGMSLNVSREIVKGLVQFRPGTFEIDPAIAQSWNVSDGGLRWTFVLKKGLKFSDGTSVDAAAVKFNFDRWRLVSNPYHASFRYPYYSDMFGGFPGLIEDVQAVAPDRVAFTLQRPFAPFLHDLAMPTFGIGSPTAIRGDLAGFAEHPVGWGPYVLSEWVKGSHIVLRANPSYPTQPTYQTVIVRDIPDVAASVEAMKDGTVDVLTDPGPEAASLLARTPGITVYYQPANNNAYLGMNMDRHPFDKLDVREAIAYALDVRGIVKTYFPTGARVANCWTPPGMSGDNPGVKAYPLDDREARRLLTEAGFRHGFHTQLTYANIPRPYMPDPQGVASAIARQLRAVGIDVKLQPLDWSVFLDRAHDGEHEMVLAGWSGDNGDPDNFMYSLLDKDSARRPNALNYSFWRDDAYHQLMLEGQATSDPAERAAIYERANALIHDQVPSIPIVHVTVPIAARTSIAGFVPSADTSINFEYLRPTG